MLARVPSGGRISSTLRGLAGQTVSLVDPDSGEVIATTTTDARGGYRFDIDDGLRTGQYQIVLTLTNSDPTTTPLSRSIAITRGGQLLTGIDFIVSQSVSDPVNPRPLHSRF